MRVARDATKAGRTQESSVSITRNIPVSRVIRERDPVHEARMPSRFRCFAMARLAGQNVGVTQVGERVWFVTFMRYDFGYFDDETCRLEPIQNPFEPKGLPMSSE